jgi:hypothetical protein
MVHLILFLKFDNHTPVILSALYHKDMSRFPSDPTLVTLIPIVLVTNAIRTLASAFFFVSHYRLPGLFICVFGSREIWRNQVQILASTRDSDAMDFKRSAQEDSNIIAVSVCLYNQYQ